MIQMSTRSEFRGVGHGAILTLHPAPDVICAKYVGDNDATCPQLTCIRGIAHPGACDNVRGDHQVWGLGPDGTFAPVSFAYDSKNSAEIVLSWARKQLPSFSLAVASSELGYRIEYVKDVSLTAAEAIEVWRKIGW